MNKSAFAFAAIVGLSGCAMLETPVPQSARLSDQTLTLKLNNGEVCRAQWRAAPEGQICGFGYVVTEVSQPNLLRQLFTGLTAALGAEGVVAPQAEVVVTRAAGQAYRFVSPPPVDLSD